MISNKGTNEEGKAAATNRQPQGAMGRKPVSSVWGLSVVLPPQLQYLQTNTENAPNSNTMDSGNSHVGISNISSDRLLNVESDPLALSGSDSSLLGGSRFIAVPFDQTQRTNGRARYFNHYHSSGDECLTLCVEYHTKSSCSAGADCGYIHADPAYVNSVLQQQGSSCCAYCGDVFSRKVLGHGEMESLGPIGLVLDTSKFKTPVEGGPQPQQATNKAMFTFPLERLCLTAAVARLQRRNMLRVAEENTLCRSHNAGQQCKWGKECAYLHVCRYRLQLIREGRIQPTMDLSGLPLGLHSQQQQQQQQLQPAPQLGLPNTSPTAAQLISAYLANPAGQRGSVFAGRGSISVDSQYTSASRRESSFSTMGYSSMGGSLEVGDGGTFYSQRSASITSGPSHRPSLVAQQQGLSQPFNHMHRVSVGGVPTVAAGASFVRMEASYPPGGGVAHIEPSNSCTIPLLQQQQQQQPVQLVSGDGQQPVLLHPFGGVQQGQGFQQGMTMVEPGHDVAALGGISVMLPDGSTAITLPHPQSRMAPQ